MKTTRPLTVILNRNACKHNSGFVCKWSSPIICVRFLTALSHQKLASCILHTLGRTSQFFNRTHSASRTTKNSCFHMTWIVRSESRTSPCALARKRVIGGLYPLAEIKSNESRWTRTLPARGRTAESNTFPVSPTWPYLMWISQKILWDTLRETSPHAPWVRCLAASGFPASAKAVWQYRASRVTTKRAKRGPSILENHSNLTGSCLTTACCR